MSTLIGVLMFLTSLFLILLVLVQRGRGGGLSGALGGMGGQSAFGTKAGDLFTRITMFTATFWILLCIAAILLLNRQSGSLLSDDQPRSPEYTSGVIVEPDEQVDNQSSTPPSKADAQTPDADSSDAANQ